MQISIAQHTHIPGILAIYKPIVKHAHVSFEYIPPGQLEMGGRIKTTLAFFPWLVALSDSSVCGYAYASRFRERKAYDRVCEVSVYVHPASQGKGVGTMLYQKLFSILVAQGMTQCIAGISLPNAQSISFHEKCGFRHVGTFQKIGYKFDQWFDVLFMQLELNSCTCPEKPIRWQDIEPETWGSFDVKR